jgi:hypothetical protein
MPQREQNGNCFCSKAAMRQQQSLMISCDTFSLGLTILPKLDRTPWRIHESVILPGRLRGHAPAAAPVREAGPAGWRKANKRQSMRVRGSKNVSNLTSVC